MVATKITGAGDRGVIGTRQMHLRMPADEYEELTTYLFETGRRTIQGFALSAVREKRAAERRSQVREAGRANVR